MTINLAPHAGVATRGQPEPSRLGRGLSEGQKGQQMSIKAIETRYKGYRFRSRLEARWAVFFDALGIEWIYEPEGVVLPDGRFYLPDFFLPSVNDGMFVEIKGGTDDGKLDALCQATGAAGFVTSLDPFDFIHGDGEDAWLGADSWDTPCKFCTCPWCGKIGFQFDGRGARVCGYKAHHKDQESALLAIKHAGHWRADDKCYTHDDPKILAAANKARGARFEHGESGA